jgi:hypothetical protein
MKHKSMIVRLGKSATPIGANRMEQKSSGFDKLVEKHDPNSGYTKKQGGLNNVVL